MKIKTTWLAMLAVAAALAPAQTTRAITFGELDNGRHPNVGAVMVRVPWQVEPVMFLSGILIQQQVLLTAGHGTDCLEWNIELGAIAVGDIFVTFSDDPYDESTYIPVAAVFTHPGYKPAKRTDTQWLDAHGLGCIPLEDMGLIVLAEPAAVQPATLPPVGFLDELKATKALNRDSVFVAVGYGSRATFPQPKPVFEPHNRELVESPYLNLNDRYLNLSQNSVLGNGGGGYGDSGGPKFWIDPADGSEHLVSITSRGDMNLVTIDVSYRIDTPAALDFIYGVMDWLEETSAQKLLTSEATAAKGQTTMWPRGAQLVVFAQDLGGWLVSVRWPVASDADHYRLTVFQNRKHAPVWDVSPVSYSLDPTTGMAGSAFPANSGTTYTVILTAYSGTNEATSNSESLQARITIR